MTFEEEEEGMTFEEYVARWRADGEAAAREKARLDNPLVRLYGPGPADKLCRDCSHMLARRHANVYWWIAKCDLRKETRGPITDHRRRWPTCWRFEAAP